MILLMQCWFSNGFSWQPLLLLVFSAGSITFAVLKHLFLSVKNFLSSLARLRTSTFVFLLMLGAFHNIILAQNVVSVKESFSTPLLLTEHPKAAKSCRSISPNSLVLPIGLVSFGFTGLGDNPVRDLDLSVKDLFRSSHPDFQTHMDDYIQYTPALAVYSLNAAGVNGDHRLKDRSLILAMTMVFSSGMVTVLKGLTHKERPDASSFNSFPSGHTATAFAGAEFLRMEYKDVSPWYGVGGYMVAAATGTLRVLNNRHWVSDVVAGAGFGILSAKLSYLVFNTVKSRAKKG
jgi:hypothetical protein